MRFVVDIGCEHFAVEEFYLFMNAHQSSMLFPLETALYEFRFNLLVPEFAFKF
jgi:hypothetical protein